MLSNRSVRTPTRKVSTLPPPGHTLRNQTWDAPSPKAREYLVAIKSKKDAQQINAPEGFRRPAITVKGVVPADERP